MLVFDKWMANADGRQCVFHRAMVRDWSPLARAHLARPAFIVRMIDHGFVFNGPNWDYPDSPVQGLYPRKVVYENVTSLDGFQPWLDQVVNFPEEVVDRALQAGAAGVGGGRRGRVRAAAGEAAGPPHAWPTWWRTPAGAASTRFPTGRDLARHARRRGGRQQDAVAVMSVGHQSVPSGVRATTGSCTSAAGRA